MYSIDQNCHSLWDTVPKLQALGRIGRPVLHCIEDIDVAFTSMGASAESEPLHLAPERFHRSGGSDWGAALYYLKFLGRLPVEIRDWEPLTGMKTNALARQLGRSVDDLYDRFSVSDNVQLIGPSYVGDRNHHRLIADLTVAEAAPFVREIIALAKADVHERFPGRAAQERTREWFAREERLVEDLLSRHADSRLVDLYRDWLTPYLSGNVRIDLTSSLFPCRPDAPSAQLLDVFVRHNEQATALYNEAVQEAGAGLHPLDVGAGEMPFFATLVRDGRQVRTGVFLQDGALRVGDSTFPLAADGAPPLARMAAAGVQCVAGKALVLAIQARLGPHGRALALPYRGSLYMPASVRLAEKLAAAGLLRGELKPIVRVRFRLLDRMGELDTVVRLPAHVAAAMGREEAPARDFAESWADLVRQACARLESFRQPEGRERWQRDNYPDLLRAVEELDRLRRQMAERDPKSPEIRALWPKTKELQAGLLERLVQQIDTDWQVRELDYFDSRGALLPWCIALGGEEFYRRVIEEAEVYAEGSPEPGRQG